MEQSELLRTVVAVFDDLRIPYFVTGSVATIYYGEPRFTNDIDIVAEIPAPLAPMFKRRFPESDFYLDEDAIREAIRIRGQFNIIHPESGLKVDVILPPNTAFNESRFERAARIQTEPGIEAVFSSPEDIILMKLQYYQAGGSDKHIRDIRGILKIAGPQLDRPYIDQWCRRMNLQDLWYQCLLS